MKPTISTQNGKMKRFEFPTVDLLDRPIGDPFHSPFFRLFDRSFVETAEGYTLEVAVPGMKRKDLSLEVSDRMLTVKGQKQKKESFGWGKGPSTFINTQFMRTFSLPDDADPSGIKAKCANGLLEIRLPKAKVARSYRVIPVETAGETQSSSWRQKLLKPFGKLKESIRYGLRKLGFGHHFSSTFK